MFHGSPPSFVEQATILAYQEQPIQKAALRRKVYRDFSSVERFAVLAKLYSKGSEAPGHHCATQPPSTAIC
ncbi:MAG: hypothetical protein EBX66_12340, partial [Betaproteobacteria bacterium]|nr:hypothetical protein [Betaproteobacteria bacterium]